jgi:hypothetical protein
MAQGLISGQYRRTTGLRRTYDSTGSWYSGKQGIKWKIEIRFEGIVKGKYANIARAREELLSDVLPAWAQKWIEDLDGMEE